MPPKDRKFRKMLANVLAPQSARADRVEPHHWNSLYLVAAISMVYMTLAVAVQPLFLRNVLNVPFANAGTINANVQVVTEILALAVIGYLGVLSDRFGRVPIVVGGFVVAAAGGILAPFSLGLGTLLGIGGIIFYYFARIIMSFGTSALSSQMATLAADFTDYGNRARYMANTAFMMAFGATLVYAVLLQIPRHTGIVAVMVLNAVVGLLGAWLARRYLIDIAPRQPEHAVAWRRIRDLLVRQPRMRVTFAAAIFSRSDIVLIGLFYMLWAIYFADLVGENQEEAAAHAGKAIGLLGLVVMLSIPVWGWIVHAFGRMNAIIAGLAISGLGFAAMGFVVNPFGWTALVPMMLIALGQGGCLLAPNVLAADLTPKDLGGSIQGAFNVVGGVGLIIILQVGGYLFDSVGPHAPFVLTGIGNLLVMVYALWVNYFAASGREEEEEMDLEELVVSPRRKGTAL